MEKIIRFVPLVLALFFIGLYKFGLWCDHVSGTCDGSFLDIHLYSIKLIYIYALWILPATIIFLFLLKEQVKKKWMILFISWTTITLFFSFTLANSGSDLSGFNLYQPSPEGSTRFLGTLFSIISITMFAVMLIRGKLKKTK